MSVGKCRRHPRQVVVGVCSACLKERLLALMIEEEELEIARHSFASSSSWEASTCVQDSPPICKLPSAYAHTSSDSSFNIFTDHCKASVASSAPRRHGMEYNREDVKHVASLYLQRHHSLSSSPLQKPTNLKVSSPLPSSVHHVDQEGRKSSTLLYGHVVAASIPRKKRGSIWSLVHRHGFESGSSSMRKDCTSKLEQHRRSLQENSTSYKCAYMSGGYTGDDEHKMSYASTLNSNALDRSSKVNTSSLSSSPRSFRSKHASGTSSYMLSPANSRHCTPLISPLQISRHGESKLLPGRRHSFADDSIYDIVDEKKPSKSWISSLFPSRGKSSKSLLSKGNDGHVYATHNPSRRQSVSASPEMAPRRKSVSFLDEHVAARSPRTTRFKTSPPRNLNNDSTDTSGSKVWHAKASSLQGMHDKYSFSGENVINHGNGRGAYHLDTVGNHDQLKSPRMKMANFLTKRRNSMGMDCTRDMRVSPAPMSITEIRSPASHTHRTLPFMIKEDVDDEAENYGSLINTGASRSTVHDNVEDDGNRTSSLIKLVPASMLDAELQDVKKSKTSQIANKALDSSSMSKSKSWGSTWSKTLSPMLGLKGKKNKKKDSKMSKQITTNMHHPQDSNGINMDNHSTLKQPNKHLRRDQNRNSDPNLSIDCSHIDHCTHLMGQHDCDHGYSSSPASLLREDDARREGPNAELLQHIQTPKLSPSSVFTPNHRRPPQQYSFLSKDYSAFSFYFSPRSKGSKTNQMISDQLRRINATDQLNPGAGTPPRHSVDGTFPAALLAGAASGR